MCKRLTKVLIILTLYTLSPFAFACDNYRMTAEHKEYLASMSSVLRVPHGKLALQPADRSMISETTDIVPRKQGCFQVDDFDGDGNEDFVGLYEYIGDKTRTGAWKLDLLLLYTDASGNARHVLFPYAGRYDASTGEVHHSLSIQPPGVVELKPGRVTLDRPGFVSSRNGKPEVLYYWNGSQFTHRIISVDD